MFAIGDNEWPGISKLVEECGEVVQVGGKLMGSRGDLEHFDGTNLARRFEEELGDLLAAISFVVMNNEAIDAEVVNVRKTEKLALFLKWHRESA